MLYKFVFDRFGDITLGKTSEVVVRNSVSCVVFQFGVYILKASLS